VNSRAFASSSKCFLVILLSGHERELAASATMPPTSKARSASTATIDAAAHDHLEDAGLIGEGGREDEGGMGGKWTQYVAILQSSFSNAWFDVRF